MKIPNGQSRLMQCRVLHADESPITILAG
ncbi:MAG: hypothetical protein COW39_07280, partial [Comamonadaceae bacterium CG17_big_fil_post_rev_8_21_14_2_50_60_13]